MASRRRRPASLRVRRKSRAFDRLSFDGRGLRGLVYIIGDALRIHIFEQRFSRCRSVFDRSRSTAAGQFVTLARRDSPPFSTVAGVNHDVRNRLAFIVFQKISDNGAAGAMLRHGQTNALVQLAL